MNPSTLRSIAFVLLGLGFVATPAHARSWWDDAWTIRNKVTLDTSAVGITEPIGSGVALVRLHDGNFQFEAAKEDGTDIRFVAEDEKTLLPYHIERYDGLLHEAFVWVKVPEVKPGTQTAFWLY